MLSICTRVRAAVRREASREPNRIGECLARLQLVRRGTLTTSPTTRTWLSARERRRRRRLQEADVARCITADQVIVDIEYLDYPSGALDLDIAEPAVVRRPSRGIQRS